jgi:hypothetical protein
LIDCSMDRQLHMNGPGLGGVLLGVDGALHMGFFEGLVMLLWACVDYMTCFTCL